MGDSEKTLHPAFGGDRMVEGVYGLLALAAQWEAEADDSCEFPTAEMLRRCASELKQALEGGCL